MKNNDIISKEIQKQIDFIALMLKEMRLAQGKTQEGFYDVGLSRRQIQRAEYKNNMTLAKLLFMLRCYGISLRDIDWND
jgi:hypothetical protein